MPDVNAFVSASRHRIAAAVIVAFALLVAPSNCYAQNQVVVLVSGDPITALDIEQRAKFLQLANNKPSARVEVAQELIDDKIKLHLTRRFDFTGHNIDGDVDSAIANMARKRRITHAQFNEQLNQLGVLATLKSRIKAEIIWTQIVRGKYQSTLQLNDSEILKELETRKTDEKEGYDYTLRPILFIVPRGSPPAAFEARRREAEGLRQRFQNCEEGIPFARVLRDIAVQNPVVRTSADLPVALREILEKTEVGRLTPPENTMEGVELYALCGKKISSKDNAIGKREVREEIYSKQFTASSKKFLKELRDQAYCTVPSGRVIEGCLAASLFSK